MARYRKVDTRMWGDAKFKSLSPLTPCGQGLWLYLLTGPETSVIPGLFRAGEAGLSEALGWSLKGFREAFAEAFREGIAKADWEARIVWLPNATKYNKPESPNVVKSWEHSWDELPECQLKDEAYEALKAFTEALGEAFAKAFRQACRKPSRKPSLNQEQEQEQEQETEESPADGSSPTQRIFDAWRLATGCSRAVLDDKRRKRIAARLAEFSEADLIRVLDGWKLDDWCQGRVAGQPKVYDAISTIYRDAEQVEKFLRLAGAPKVVHFSGREPKGVDELRREAEEAQARIDAEAANG
jgi:hypothetical protein